jgi:thiosulfate sulfurtransferase
MSTDRNAPTYRTLSAAAAKTLLDEGTAQLIDIRDVHAFTQAHIAGAVRIDNANVDAFIGAVDKTVPLIVCCYHGISSRNAAQFFAEQGCREVYSLDGGFEGWCAAFPDGA